MKAWFFVSFLPYNLAMRTNRDMNWEMMQKALASEASGKTAHTFSSRRTLFGIPSSLDEELASIAQESTKQCAENMEGGNGLEDEGRNAKPKDKPTVVRHPLEPVFDANSRVLVLGTMPSPKSRETGFYYNHPQNRFWPVMARLFSCEVPATNAEKRALALGHNIALWDVLAQCEIEGAKDGTIARCIPNDVARITSSAPIQAVFCTGAKAYELYGKHCEPQTQMEAVKLPSTSSANASYSLDRLVDAYREILEHL